MHDRMVEWAWYAGSWPARLARSAVSPLASVFSLAVALRNAAFDRGWLASFPLALPAVSVGNLTVGGTGKTPVAAWIASQLARRGGRPAIVTRGYRGDEPLVHAHLNPGVPVIIDSDRVRGTARALEEGATEVVLDDAFQHQRAKRDLDVVLVSAERFGAVRLMPAGPWREPLASLARADAVVVTRKSAAPGVAREVLSRVIRFAPDAVGAIIHLAPDALEPWPSGERRPLSALSGAAILAVSAIGDAAAFEAQLRGAGARIDSAAFDDHHAFTAREGVELARRARSAELTVCTLKDAVKLGPYWPREATPIWYLSQRVSVEVGEEALLAMIHGMASAAPPGRSSSNPPPAPAGSTGTQNAG